MNKEEIIDGEDFNDEEIEFIPCSECDGHPACEDFGCAIEAGLRRLLKKELTSDDL